MNKAAMTMTNAMTNMTNEDAKAIIKNNAMTNMVNEDAKASLRMKMFSIVFKNTIEHSKEKITIEKVELMKRVFACFIMATKIKVESNRDITTYKFNNEKSWEKEAKNLIYQLIDESIWFEDIYENGFCCRNASNSYRITCK